MMRNPLEWDFTWKEFIQLFGYPHDYGNPYFFEHMFFEWSNWQETKGISLISTLDLGNLSVFLDGEDVEASLGNLEVSDPVQ